MGGSRCRMVILHTRDHIHGSAGFGEVLRGEDEVLEAGHDQAERGRRSPLGADGLLLLLLLRRRRVGRWRRDKQLQAAQRQVAQSGQQDALEGRPCRGRGLTL